MEGKVQYSYLLLSLKAKNLCRQLNYIYIKIVIPTKGFSVLHKLLIKAHPGH